VRETGKITRLLVGQRSLNPMVRVTRVSGYLINTTEQEPKNGQMALGLKANTSMARNVVKDSSDSSMEDFIKVNSHSTRLKAGERSGGPMGVNT
jgi:hypothetical protein